MDIIDTHNNNDDADHTMMENLSSMVASQIAITACDDEVGIMKTHGSQCM